MSTPHETAPQSSRRGSGTRLSVWRIFAALSALTALIAVAVLGVRMYEANAEDDVHHWFAGYVDVTAMPRYAFEAGERARELTDAQEELAEEGEEAGEEAEEDPAEGQGTRAPVHDVVLSFIVDHGEGDCTPSWGTHHTLEEASTALELDRRIQRLREREASVVVSFGGAINDELALVCESVEELTAAYTEVVERYGLDTIDLDIEGEALQDAESILRRAEAVAALQESRHAEGAPLAVWLTLPVLPTGMTPEAIRVVEAMLEADVDLAGVNLMTMNYGESRAGMGMLEASTEALTSAHRQLGILYDRAETPLSEGSLWAKLGATPMIGQNDVPGEVFTLADAEGLSEFAQEKGLGRMSLWSLNRDITCGPNYPDVARVSDACSGVDQGEVTFTELLAAGFTGRSAEAARSTTTPEPQAAEPVVDDPETSPYPIWQQEAAYLEGTKVVWRQNVYQAKWWTKGDVPDDPVLDAWDTPWELIGPVLPGETPAPPLTLPDGTYPEWSGAATYEREDRVLFDGVPYEAKWWTRGDTPETAAMDPDGSPWRPLTAEEVAEAGED